MSYDNYTAPYDLINHMTPSLESYSNSGYVFSYCEISRKALINHHSYGNSTLNFKEINPKKSNCLLDESNKSA